MTAPMESADVRADEPSGAGAGPEASPSPSGRVMPFGTWALFLGLGLLMVGNGLNGAVIGVRTSSEGFGSIVTGLIVAGYFAGFLLASAAVVRMIPAVGHIRVFAGLASTASTAVLVHSVSVSAITWISMRFVFGFCMAGLYIVIESWLGEVATPATRGRTMATYMVVSMGGLGAGQFLISLADPSTFRLFVLSSVLVSMSLVPVTLGATTRAPNVSLPAPMGVVELARVVPTAVVGSFVTGAGAGLVFGVGAVYAANAGLSIDRTAVFLVAPTIGAVLFQLPLGRVSDRFSRRAVILAVASAACAVSITGAIWNTTGPVAPLIMFAIGATLFPLYSIVVSYAHDWVPHEKVVGASASLVRINGSGAMVAPLVVAPLVAGWTPVVFYWAFVVAFGLLAGFVAWRVAFRDALPRERQGEFVLLPVRATASVLRLATRPVAKRRPGARAAANPSAAAGGHQVPRGRDPAAAVSDEGPTAG
ncbi:MAG: MFS transporter [Actinomycetota bacterium]